METWCTQFHLVDSGTTWFSLYISWICSLYRRVELPGWICLTRWERCRHFNPTVRFYISIHSSLTAVNTSYSVVLHTSSHLCPFAIRCTKRTFFDCSVADLAVGFHVLWEGKHFFEAHLAKALADKQVDAEVLERLCVRRKLCNWSYSYPGK